MRGLGETYIIQRGRGVGLVKDGFARMRHDLIEAASGHHISTQEDFDAPCGHRGSGPDPADLRFPSGNRRRCRFWMSDNYRRNRNITLRKVECSFAFGGPKPGLRKSNPACSKTGGAGRKHEVFGSERTILDGPRALHCARDNDESWCMIENIKVRIAQNISKMMRYQTRRRHAQHMGFRFARYARENGFVLHNAEGPRLLIDGAQALARPPR